MLVGVYFSYVGSLKLFSGSEAQRNEPDSKMNGAKKLILGVILISLGTFIGLTQETIFSVNTATSELINQKNEAGF